MEGLLGKVIDDVLALKEEVAKEVREAEQDSTELGRHFPTLEDSGDAREEQIEALHQEMITLHEQTIDLQHL